MDIDNLQGLIVYLIFQMKNPGIIADYFLISEFVSRNVQISSRSIFLNVLKGGVDYILKQIEMGNDPTPKATPNHSFILQQQRLSETNPPEDQMGLRLITEEKTERDLSSPPMSTLFLNKPQFSGFTKTPTLRETHSPSQ
jgi:hypothetical protein